MNKSLYELLNMNRRQSTLKSVFVSNRISENCVIVNVEAYDETGYNALNTTPYKFDKFCAYLDKTLLDNYSLIAGQDLNIRVCIYGIYRVEYILTRSGTVF
jgi:hypothetical protein